MKGDLGILTNLGIQALQAVTVNFNPLTENDTFTATTYQHLSVPDHYIIDVPTVETQLAKINTRKAVGPDARSPGC